MKALIFLCTLSLSVLFSKPIENIETTYYSIYPNTKYELQTQLDQRSPSEHHAYTKWNITWDFDTKKSLNSCKIKNLKVFLNVKYVMPKIPAVHPVRIKVLNVFKKYSKALKNYQKNHVLIANVAANQIERNLKGLKAKTCGNLEKNIDSIANNILKKFRKKQKNLDRRTNFGKTKGASLDKYM